MSRGNSSNGLDNYKLTLLGRAAVGKSALLVRYMTGRFIWEYDPTLEATYRHNAAVDEDTALIEILDTAGQGELGDSDGKVRWSDGFMLVYNITDRESFEHIPALKRHLDDVKKARNVSCVLVGNKADLEQGRRVSYSDGETLAADLACAFFETSASEGSSEIGEAFHELCREVKRRRALEGKSRRRSSAQQMKQVLNKMLTKIQTG